MQAAAPAMFPPPVMPAAVATLGNAMGAIPVHQQMANISHSAAVNKQYSRQNQRPNTTKAYEKTIKEWQSYRAYFHGGPNSHLFPDSVYERHLFHFLWFHAYRKKRNIRHCHHHYDMDKYNAKRPR
jgi:hypothetical protein